LRWKGIETEIGTTFALDRIAESCGIKEVLIDTMPLIWRDLLSCAFYIVSKGNAMTGYDAWRDSVDIPFGSSVCERDLHGLFKMASQSNAMDLFKRWRGHMKEPRLVLFEMQSAYNDIIDVEGGGAEGRRRFRTPPSTGCNVICGRNDGIPTYVTLNEGVERFADGIAYSIANTLILGFESMHCSLGHGRMKKDNVHRLDVNGVKFIMPFTRFSSNCAKLISLKPNMLKSDQYRYNRHHWAPIGVWSTFPNDVGRIHLMGNQTLYDMYSDPSSDCQDGFLDDVALDVSMLNDLLIAGRIKAFFTNDPSLLTSDILKIEMNRSNIEKGFDGMLNMVDLHRFHLNSPHAIQGRGLISFISSVLRSYGAHASKGMDFDLAMSIVSEIRRVTYPDGSTGVTMLRPRHIEALKALNLPIGELS